MTLKTDFGFKILLKYIQTFRVKIKFMLLGGCDCRFRRSWIYRRHQGFLNTWPRSYSSQKHSATRSCCQRRAASIWRPHTGGIAMLKDTFFIYISQQIYPWQRIYMCIWIGKLCGYHRGGPGGVSVHAPKHSSRRDCVPGGFTAGWDVPAQRNGKNQSQC